MIRHDPLIEAARQELYRRVDDASKALRAIPVERLANGLTPDAVKFSPEYRAAKAAYDRAFQAVRAFNTKHKPPRFVRTLSTMENLRRAKP